MAQNKNSGAGPWAKSETKKYQYFQSNSSFPVFGDNLKFINYLAKPIKKPHCFLFDREQRSKVLKEALLFLFLAWWKHEQKMF